MLHRNARRALNREPTGQNSRPIVVRVWQPELRQKQRWLARHQAWWRRRLPGSRRLRRLLRGGPHRGRGRRGALAMPRSLFGRQSSISQSQITLWRPTQQTSTIQVGWDEFSWNTGDLSQSSDPIRAISQAPRCKPNRAAVRRDGKAERNTRSVPLESQLQSRNILAPELASSDMHLVGDLAGRLADQRRRVEGGKGGGRGTFVVVSHRSGRLAGISSQITRTGQHHISAFPLLQPAALLLQPALLESERLWERGWQARRHSAKGMP
mmetsp:Transcript_121196/g.387148  ORF Transcript_121196/g.387148 Transcript_121196/m.387148 type:complete len:267 (+) Transcript_121196:3888-4688(+)